jgi:hypothetical protein
VFDNITKKERIPKTILNYKRKTSRRKTEIKMETAGKMSQLRKQEHGKKVRRGSCRETARRRDLIFRRTA